MAIDEEMMSGHAQVSLLETHFRVTRSSRRAVRRPPANLSREGQSPRGRDQQARGGQRPRLARRRDRRRNAQR